MQFTSTILMIRPAAFGYNEQTAESNAFQTIGSNQQQVQQAALQEFDAMVNLLRQHDIDVIVLNDTDEPVKPDAIFPNNWVSFHENGDVILYPMQAHNRRLERREDLIRKLEDHYQVNHIIDLSRFEIQDKYLEGTGSMVLDRENKIAYACLSPRTNEEALEEFCRCAGYTTFTFNGVDAKGQAIYHTNVLMCMGHKFAVVCLECVKDDNERRRLAEQIHHTGKEIVEITFSQLAQFAGNMLEVANKQGQPKLIMSYRAYQSLTELQKAKLGNYAELLHPGLETIENNGGGSARCMMAEVYLPVAEH
ncbi:arginine deiminase-related protein [Mucilaginibacter koreensis]